MRYRVFHRMAEGLLGTVLLLAAFSPAAAECRYCPDLVDLPGGLAMGRTEVTHDQWQACVDDSACRAMNDDHGWGRGSRPVVDVTWDDVQDYLAWLSARTGESYRLPTEAEWELAARGGTGTTFWWGDKPGKGNANCRRCGKPAADKTLPVASLKPNPFGLYDMNGNVWEWTSDCYDPPPQDGACPSRAVRGGSWYFFPHVSAASSRAPQDVRGWSYDLGFRVVRD